MEQYGPNPDSIYPNEKIKQICFIKNVVKNPNIQIGDSNKYPGIKYFYTNEERPCYIKRF